MDHEYGERLAGLEARLAAIESFMIRMEAKWDAFQTNYVPRAEINEMFRSRDAQIARIDDEAKQKRQNWPVWVGIAASAAVSIYTAFHK